MSGQPVVY